MRKPVPLAVGSVVRVVAPAGPVPADRFAAGVQVLAGWGLVPRWEPRAFDVDGYLAGPDAGRADELVHAFVDDGADGVLAARGGYGSMRILDALAAASADLRSRMFQGFSDLTAVHACLGKVAGLVTIHGANVTTLAQLDGVSLARTRAALLGLDREATFAWDGLHPVAGGRASGPLLAGNLTMLCALAGTRFAPVLDGAILVVEDVAEPAYRIDRLLTQVALSVDAPRIAGVALGDLGVPPAEGARLDAAVRRFAEALGRPVVSGFPAGHGSALHPVPEGVRAELDADAGTLRVVEDPYAGP